MPDEKGGTLLFGIDFDTEAGHKKLKELKEMLHGIGDTESLGGILAQLGHFGALAAVAAGAAYAVKVAMDWAVEGEAIVMINKQFEILTKESGIAADTLREGLLAASKGTIEETDLLKSANKAIVTLGASAAELPRLFELSRKAAVVMGGSTQEVFDNLIQSISMGQTKALKQFNVNAEKAYKEYALALGTIPQALTEVEKRQALLNAVLAEGEKKFHAVDANGKMITSGLAKMSAAAADFEEVFKKALFQTVGPFFERIATGSANTTRTWTAFIKSFIGSDTDKAKAEIDLTNLKIEKLHTTISDLESKKGGFFSFFNQQQIAVANAELEKAIESKKKLEESIPVPKEKYGPFPLPKHEENDADLAAKAKFYKDLSDIKKLNLDAAIIQAATEKELATAQSERLVQLESDTQAKIKAIKVEYKGQDDQAKLLIAATQQNAADERVKLEIKSLSEIENLEVASIQRRIDLSKDASDKFALGFQLKGAQARKSLNDFSAFGQQAFNSLSGAIKNSFAEWGAGGISLGEALKKAAIGSIADIAAAQGAALIASSIWPPNPLGLAAGAGLVALSGALRSAVGASSSVSSAGGGGGGGGSVSTASAPIPAITQAPSPERFADKRKQVSINIQGNYFDTDETRRRLTQMIREESDASDFKILSVGGGV